MKVSDAFLNLNNVKPSYESEQQNLQDGDKKDDESEESKKKAEEDDDNDDFERDEDDTEGFQGKSDSDLNKVIKEQLKEID